MTTATMSVSAEYSIDNIQELSTATKNMQMVVKMLQEINFKSCKIVSDGEAVEKIKQLYAKANTGNPWKDFLSSWVACRDFVVDAGESNWDLRVQVRLDSIDNVEVIFNHPETGFVVLNVFISDEQSEEKNGSRFVC